MRHIVMLDGITVCECSTPEQVDIFRAAGLIPDGATITVAPSVDEVKAEASLRIRSRYPLWKQMNVVREGGEPLTEMSAYIDAVRAASDALEISLTADFRADAHWPE